MAAAADQVGAGRARDDLPQLPALLRLADAERGAAAGVGRVVADAEAAADVDLADQRRRAVRLDLERRAAVLEQLEADLVPVAGCDDDVARAAGGADPGAGPQRELTTGRHALAGRRRRAERAGHVVDRLAQIGGPEARGPDVVAHVGDRRADGLRPRPRHGQQRSERRQLGDAVVVEPEDVAVEIADIERAALRIRIRERDAHDGAVVPDREDKIDGVRHDRVIPKKVVADQYSSS